MGVRDNQTRKLLLQETKLTLQRCIDICRSADAAASQLKVMGGTGDDINYIRAKSQAKVKSYPNPSANGFKCKFCGRSHTLKKELCPAYGKKCTTCQKMNHFAAMCRQTRDRKKVHALDADSASETDEEFVLQVTGSKQHKATAARKEIKAKMSIGTRNVDFQIDSGASVNVLPKELIPKDTKIIPTNKILTTWDGTKVKPEGSAKVGLKKPTNQKKYSVELIVVSKGFMPLIGKNASEQMNLITVNYKNFESVLTVQDDLLNTHVEVFKDTLGKLPGEVTISVDETVRPVCLPARRIPVEIKPRVRAELDKMVDQGIIAPVDEPTDWVSQMVVVSKKSGQLRICIDPRPLNTAIRRERYQLPILEDVLPELNKAKVFSTVDLRNGYWHLLLDDSSSKLTCFQTPWGRYKWLRLPFGTSCSSEIFQKRLHQALEGLENIICIADDIIVYGKGEDMIEAYRDHDDKLKKLLERCSTLGLRLNKEKCKLRRTEVKFLGHLVTKDGLKADPEKVTAILEMPKPQNAEDIHRLNGTVNYLARFLDGLADVMDPLRQLSRLDTKTRKHVEWTWGEVHDSAFEKLKQMIAEAPILAYYNTQEELEIQCDASDKGIGAVLMQTGKPIAYMSRALTPAETRYAPIEKEMLAIVTSLERFHQYTYGRHTKVTSDHKPLESILKKPLNRAPRRLQSMMLRTQVYDFTVCHKPGKDILLADMLSRAYLPVQETVERVDMVHFLPIREERLAQIRAETEKDDILSELRKVILQGWPDTKDHLPVQISPYFNIRDEMTVQDGLVIRGERVVVPTSLRRELKQAIHSSHVGIEGCLRRARECLYWPGMSADIKQFIAACEICRTYEVTQQKEPLMPQDLPSRPWEKVATDLFKWNKGDYLVTVDYFSNFFEIDALENTEAKTVIKKIKGHFARYGIPCQLISDNGPQFTSEEFRKFAKTWGMEHYTSSPYNSKANGKAESAVKTAKRLMQKARDSKSDPYLALLDYRNTPSPSIGSSPAQRLMNRRTRTLLPMMETLLRPRSTSYQDRAKMQTQQDKQCEHYNKTARDLKPLEEGDVVRMKPFQLGEKKWQKAVVVKRLDERSYDVETQDGCYRRNRQHLNKTKEDFPIVISNNLPMAMLQKRHQRQPHNEVTVPGHAKGPTPPPKQPGPLPKCREQPDPAQKDQTPSPKQHRQLPRCEQPDPGQEGQSQSIHTRSGRSIRRPEKLDL